MEITDKTLAKLSAKETVEKVFEDMGGVPTMVEWAKANPGTFYTQMYGKLIHQAIDLNVKGIRIDLPWLASRPGRPPVTLEHDNAGDSEPVQVRPAPALHSAPQPGTEIRMRRLSQAKRKDGEPGK